MKALHVLAPFFLLTSITAYENDCDEVYGGPFIFCTMFCVVCDCVENPYTAVCKGYKYLYTKITGESHVPCEVTLAPTPSTSVIPTLSPTGPSASSDLIISGVIDGDLFGGRPKAIELFVVNNIPDLSIYGIGSANNGGGSDGQEFTFPAISGSAGSFIYVATESVGFTSFFGFAPNYTSSAASINGDDAIELFKGGTVVDLFGDTNVDGSGEPWEYMDGWVYRQNTTGPDGTTFVLGNWIFSGPNALDGEMTNAGAATPFPLATCSF